MSSPKTNATRYVDIGGDWAKLTRSIPGRASSSVRPTSGMFDRTASPARCGTMICTVNSAFRAGSSKQGNAERAPVYTEFTILNTEFIIFDT